MSAPVQYRTFPRATPPFFDALADALRPILPSAGFHLAYESGAVRVAYPDFQGVDLAAIQAEVAAAPVDSPQLQQQAAAERLDPILRAALLVLLDLLNTERAQHSRPAVTPVQFVAAVKARL